MKMKGLNQIVGESKRFPFFEALQSQKRSNLKLIENAKLTDVIFHKSMSIYGANLRSQNQEPNSPLRL